MTEGSPNEQNSVRRTHKVRFNVNGNWGADFWVLLSMY